MNLTQLRYVMAVAETGSFTAAAERCYVTQPTLSNGIAQLEEEFEERLFTRTTRSVSLTPFGEHILPYIEQVMNTQANLIHEVRHYVRPAKPVIRIGTSPLVNPAWLGSTISRYQQKNPEMEIILHEQNMADLYRMLDDGLLDFVFGVRQNRRNSWHAVFLYEEPLFFIPRGKKLPSLTEKKSVLFDDIATETFVMVPDACGLARSTRNLFRTHRRKLNEYSGEALSYQVLEEWASLGLGAAILPQSRLSSGYKKVFPIASKSGKNITIAFEAVWPKPHSLPQHLQGFVQHLQQTAHQAKEE
ncbi:LysR family transcriptional regulator [Oxalobacter vibrioformis]|uniref:LysR family transcriptional regulator n=1 Tax=Oxalobacter vibrioformis TaxID=933080 RepID=A0A9E9LX79_9BURK|nr:LysR family transcriptional regulator [Oxalobacter vibrioformis]WAW10941.1 LysR family transcriptional regulator [Oxalobacter vibrioformis]